MNILNILFVFVSLFAALCLGLGAFGDTGTPFEHYLLAHKAGASAVMIGLSAAVVAVANIAHLIFIMRWPPPPSAEEEHKDGE